MRRIAIIGGGAWGTALALVAARAGAHVMLWARDPAIAEGINERHENTVYLPDIPLDTTIAATTNPEAALDRADAVLLENVDCEGGKFFGVEAGVVGDEDGGLGGFRFGVFGDGGDGKTDGGESEVVGDESAPAGGTEFDWRSGDARRSAHIFHLRVVSTTCYLRGSKYSHRKP